MTHQTTTIALNKLVPWDGNVRKTNVSDGIEELAASIAAHGLLQSLVVRKSKRGKYAVVAGQRRLLALQSLAQAKTIAPDADIPCVIADGDVDATELSLAENTVRMPMHPADQFEAFRTLVDDGASVGDVAARFGVSETLVVKRLKLGRVSPVILDAYRADEIDLELVQAFAVSDDTEAQERVWNGSQPWNLHPHTVKRALTEGEIPSSDKRVKLVGLDAYEAAGGFVRRDLFDGNDNSGYVTDTGLLNRLVAEKLEAAASDVRAEGWKWVEIVPELGYEQLSKLGRLYAEDAPLSDEAQAELDALKAEYDELVDSDDDNAMTRCDEIDARIDELTDAAAVWTPETLAVAGAIVSIGYSGDIRIERGLVRPEDRPGKSRAAPSPDGSGDGKPVAKLSARLIEDLTAQKSAAISAELAGNPAIALAAVVYALALDVFYTYRREGSCVKLHATVTALSGALYEPEQCTGFTALEESRNWWQEWLPSDPANLWAWCLDQSQENLLALLAVITAHSVDAIVGKNGRPHPHADALAKALELDMAGYFTPTAANYFSRISGAGIIAALCEAKGVDPAPSWAKMKKAELASLAERQIPGTGWLPQPVRIHDPVAIDADDEDGEHNFAELDDDDDVQEAAE